MVSEVAGGSGKGSDVDDGSGNGSDVDDGSGNGSDVDNDLKDDETSSHGSSNEGKEKDSANKSSSRESANRRCNTSSGKPSCSLLNSELETKVKASRPRSRSDKRKSATLKSGATDLYQTFIPNYFEVLDKIGKLSTQNQMLSQQLKDLVTAFKQQQQFFSFDDDQKDTDPMSLLKRMMNQAISQSAKEKRGRRYQDPVLLDFSLNLWILGGPRTYEILHDNLPGIFPSPTTIQGKLAKYNASCMPGRV